MNYFKKLRRGAIRVDQIDAIIFDFDGVLTDNTVLVNEQGIESVLCNRSDGLGISYLKARKIPMTIISTETNPVVSTRAKKLGIPVLQGIGNKQESLKAYCTKHTFDLRKVIFIGNDTNDLEAMRAVGYPIAPADAHPQIKKIARYVTHAKGGQGVARELADAIK